MLGHRYTRVWRTSNTRVLAPLGVKPRGPYGDDAKADEVVGTREWVVPRPPFHLVDPTRRRADQGFVGITGRTTCDG